MSIVEIDDSPYDTLDDIAVNYGLSIQQHRNPNDIPI